jgi:hypothetical protein
VGQEEKQEKSPEIKDVPALPESEVAALSAEVAASDTASLNEARQLSSGRSLDDLKKESLQREHDRTEDFRDIFDGLVKLGMSIAFLGIIALGVIWVWHLITPESWQWLSHEQIDHIQGMITGGVLAAVVGDHFKRRLG